MRARMHAGKTRSLLEASKRTPLIIIRLDNSNVVYKRLLDRVEEEVAKVKPDTSFDRWRQCNRRVMLYVRAFFFSYMEYAHDYKGACLIGSVVGRLGPIYRDQCFL